MTLSKPLASAAAAALLSGCQTLVPNNEIETTIENELYPSSIGIIECPYGGAWSHRSVAEGNGVFIRLYRSDFHKGSYDGHSHSEITFQLPSTVRPGVNYQLTPLAPVTGGAPIGPTKMRSGELAASVFGNPFVGWLEKAKLAEVTIISIRENKAKIHLHLKADLESFQGNEPPMFTFDIDDEFELKIARPK